MIHLMIMTVGYGWVVIGVLTFLTGITSKQLSPEIPLGVIWFIHMLIFGIPGFVLGALGSILRELKIIQKSEVYIEGESK